jgi:hypothetical protein
MQQLSVGLCALALVSWISLLPEYAQAQTETVAKHHAGPFQYEIGNEIKMAGTVSSVLMKPAPGMIMGPHLLLETSAGAVDVSLGIFALKGKHVIALETGQSIEATGIMLAIKDNQVFLARTLNVGGQVRTLRDEHGYSLSPEALLRMERHDAEEGKQRGSKDHGTAASIVVVGGTPQSTMIGTAFPVPLVVEVLDRFQQPVSGAAVTFTAPVTGASCKFAKGLNTAKTDASGIAKSPILTANKTNGGPYTVKANVEGVRSAADFSLTNTLLRVLPTNFSFYLSGQENIQDSPYFYALAGAVRIDADSGKVLGGEQDYNDGSGTTGLASPQPSGDTILGGKLAVNAQTGQGKLTLITSNKALGVKGTETFGVQFVNAKHALIVQFDGKATSIGSMDLQTLPSRLQGNFSFIFSGVDSNYFPKVGGGVFTIGGVTETSDGTLANGIVDTNDSGVLTQGASFGGNATSISAFDSFGRGTITGTGFANTINYYIIGSKAIRFINVDTDNSAIGSAFGRDINNASLASAGYGSAVFAIGNTPLGNPFAVAGMATTGSKPDTFSGVADDDEQGTTCPSSGGSDSCPLSISGTYSIGSNGYGSLTIPPNSSGNAQLGDVQTLGVYVVDQALNISDPNNKASGLGGALVVDLDSALAGTGVAIPDTDDPTSGLAGKYAFGAQEYNNDLNAEFDFVGQGSVDEDVLAGTGLVSDPFLSLSADSVETGVKFSGTATPDPQNSGRYTMNGQTPLTLTSANEDENISLDMVIYRANGGRFLWMEEDGDFVSLGSLEQQSATPTPLHQSPVIIKRN